MIYVLNKRGFDWAGHPNTVMIGRPTAFGNPFFIGHGGRTRAEVVHQYKLFLWNALDRKDGRLYKSFVGLTTLARDLHQRGEDLHLICYCAPEACHGDVLKAALEYYIKDENFEAL